MYIYTHVAAGAEGNFVEFLWSEPEIFDQGGKSSAGGESSCQTRSVARSKGELRGGRKSLRQIEWQELPYVALMIKDGWDYHGLSFLNFVCAPPSNEC